MLDSMHQFCCKVEDSLGPACRATFDIATIFTGVNALWFKIIHLPPSTQWVIWLTVLWALFRAVEGFFKMLMTIRQWKKGDSNGGLE